MARKTAGVEELVQDVLRTFSPPYGEDIIEEVCLAIEHDPAWRKRYDQLGDELSLWVVNCWIGRYGRTMNGGLPAMILAKISCPNWWRMANACMPIPSRATGWTWAP